MLDPGAGQPVIEGEVEIGGPGDHQQRGEGDEGRPDQRDIGIVVGPGGEDGDDLARGRGLGGGDRGGDAGAVGIGHGVHDGISYHEPDEPPPPKLPPPPENPPPPPKPPPPPPQPEPPPRFMWLSASNTMSGPRPPLE